MHRATTITALQLPAMLALLALWLNAAQAAAGATPAAAGATCADCREGDFNSPRIHFYWVDVTAQQCCGLCTANATCAFAIHDGAVGNCYPSPATSTGCALAGLSRHI